MIQSIKALNTRFSGIAISQSPEGERHVTVYDPAHQHYSAAPHGVYCNNALLATVDPALVPAYDQLMTTLGDQPGEPYGQRHRQLLSRVVGLVHRALSGQPQEGIQTASAIDKAAWTTFMVVGGSTFADRLATSQRTSHGDQPAEQREVTYTSLPIVTNPW